MPQDSSVCASRFIRVCYIFHLEHKHFIIGLVCNFRDSSPAVAVGRVSASSSEEETLMASFQRKEAHVVSSSDEEDTLFAKWKKQHKSAPIGTPKSGGKKKTYTLKTAIVVSPRKGDRAKSAGIDTSKTSTHQQQEASIVFLDGLAHSLERLANLTKDNGSRGVSPHLFNSSCELFLSGWIVSRRQWMSYCHFLRLGMHCGLAMNATVWIKSSPSGLIPKQR